MESQKQRVHNCSETVYFFPWSRIMAETEIENIGLRFQIQLTPCFKEIAENLLGLPSKSNVISPTWF